MLSVIGRLLSCSARCCPPRKVRCFVGVFGGIVRKRKDEQWLYRTERLSFIEATRWIWEGPNAPPPPEVLLGYDQKKKHTEERSSSDFMNNKK